MNLDVALLARFGISFYNDELKENMDPKVRELQNYFREDCPSYTADNTNDSDRFHAAPVSPTLSDILHEFSVPDGIESTKESIKDFDKPLVKESVVPYDNCFITDLCSERTKKETDTLQEIPEEPITIDESDGEPCPVPEPVPEKLNCRGRKRLPKEKVIPGKWYCKRCDKNFMSKGGLLQHSNSRHSTDKTHLCDICNKRFKFPQDMQEHRARHSADNKPHGCSFEGCDKRFIHRTDLKRHFMKHHGNLEFRCRICDKGFSRKDHLVKHLISHKNKTVKKF